MPTETTISMAPAADPNFPILPSGNNSALVVDSDPLTIDEVEFMQSIFWYWEEYSPYSRSQDTTGRIPDLNLEMLTSIRAKLASMKPATT